jgi:SAM-dependent methyltransferase
MHSSPRALRTEQTLSFLGELLPRACRVLEVGCGRGEVACALVAAGHRVTALDRALRDPAPAPPGLTYVEADFLAYDAEPFDAVLFTSSLHHISPLDPAIERAAALTAPGGVVIADDFDLESPDAETLRWYYELQELLAAGGLYPADRIDPPRADLTARWRDAHIHDPPLHTGTAMQRSLAARFTLREPRRCEYLYRYLCGRLPDDARGAELAAHILATERRRIAEGHLVPVGLRLVADRA